MYYEVIIVALLILAVVLCKIIKEYERRSADQARILLQQGIELVEKARHIEALEETHFSEMQAAREEGMALTVREALREGFQKGVGYALLSSTAVREREYEHGRGV